MWFIWFILAIIGIIAAFYIVVGGAIAAITLAISAVYAVIVACSFIANVIKKIWMLLIPAIVIVGTISWINLILIPTSLWTIAFFLIIFCGNAIKKHMDKIDAEKEEKAEADKIAEIKAKEDSLAKEKEKAEADKISAAKAEAYKIAKEKEKAASDFANSKKTKVYVINPLYFDSLNKMFVEAYAPSDIIETIHIITQTHSYELIKIINPKHLKDAKIVSSLKILIRNSMLPSNAIVFKDVNVVTIAPKPATTPRGPERPWEDRPNGEPTMEEILDSIRRIIREDDEEAA